MSRSRSSVASDDHGRLEPRLLRAAESDDVEALKLIVESARENGQFSDNFLQIGLIRSAERDCIGAAQYLLGVGGSKVVDEKNIKAGSNNHRPSPLLRAVERNQVRIVQLFLDYGASPEVADKKGRTALMTAAWKNHWHVLQLLLSHGANVNAKDLMKRNVLHNLAADKQCDWGHDVVDLLLRTSCLIDGPDARDLLGRTPLHWACATGKLRLAEQLLTRPQGPKADVDAVELRNKTALHMAAAHNRDDIVRLLLRHHADVNAQSDGGWTPLHNACDQGYLHTVRLLLQAGANVNSQLLNGVTPLHLAAQAGHREVVECLLERSDLKRNIRDNFGSTPFLRAAQFKQREIVLLLAPFNNVQRLSDDAIGACKAFEATVVDFGNFHNENRVQRASVYDVLYGRDAQNPRKQAFTAFPTDKATEFRWIHLPANNMAWVEGLLTKSFIEEGAHDVDGFKGLERSFNYHHRGQRVHSRFMRPLCQNTPRQQGFCEEDSSDGKEKDSLPAILVSAAFQDSKSPSSGNKKLPKNNKPNGAKLELQDSQPEEESGKCPGRKRKATGKPAKSGSGMPKADRQKGRSQFSINDKNRTASLFRDSSQLMSSNVCVFMPYLHFETVERRQKMQEAIQRAETLNFHQRAERSNPSRDELLIRAHLNSSTASLHVRRTLDQFFYPNIDTQSRDQDQVVYRYQTKWQAQHESPATDAKIFMVDQLWMWILGKRLIVTSFPQRWDQPRNDPLNVLDGIIENINSKTKDPVRSVFDLAVLITNRCSGVFDRHRIGDEEYQFLDMFEASIGIATDRETILFKNFHISSAQASTWVRDHRRLGRFTQNLLRPTVAPHADAHHDPWSSPQPADEQPIFVDNLLDIGQEIDLLTEAKDIRDELNMLRTVLQHQQNVLLDLQEVVSEAHQAQHRRQQELKKRFKDQQRTLDMHLKDIDRMDTQAHRICSSITDLLDLKQRHANCLEARFARDQATGTTRQGKTIMVFTIVTIVFLPLSFITSIFAINIVDFPHSAGGGNGPNGPNGLDLAYVSKYTFGIGFAISIPLIVLALSVDDIGVGFRGAVWRLRRSLGGGAGRKGRRRSLPRLEGQLLLRSGVEDVFGVLEEDKLGSSLLPVGTGGTAGGGRAGARKTFAIMRRREVGIL